MEEHNESLFPLWRERGALPRIPRAISVILLVLCAAAPLLLPYSAAGGPSMVLGGAILALLLTADRTPLWLLSLPAAAVVSLLLRQATAPEQSMWLWLFSGLSFVPVGMVLAACIYGKRSLASTAAALTLTFVLLIGLHFALEFHISYGNALLGLRTVGAQVKGQLTAALSALVFPGEEGLRYLNVSEIALLLETTVMLTPAMAILLCELLAYGTAKLFRLLTLKLYAGALFREPRWAIAASLPANLLMTVSFLLLLVLPESSVAGYAAMNLFCIFLPVTAIGGFHATFGKEARAQRSPGANTILIVLCAVSACLYLPAALVLLALWGAVRSFTSGMRSLTKKIMDAAGDDDFEDFDDDNDGDTGGDADDGDN